MSVRSGRLSELLAEDARNGLLSDADKEELRAMGVEYQNPRQGVTVNFRAGELTAVRAYMTAIASQCDDSLVDMLMWAWHVGVHRGAEGAFDGEVEDTRSPRETEKA